MRKNKKKNKKKKTNQKKKKKKTTQGKALRGFSGRLPDIKRVGCGERGATLREKVSGEGGNTEAGQKEN